MGGPEKPADRIVRLIREAAEDHPTQRSGPQIVISGDGSIFGNVHGDVITVHSAPMRSLTRTDRKVIRASAVSFIRWTCRRLGDASRYRAFAIDEFGTADLEQLDETQLERIRGWCAAQLR